MSNWVEMDEDFHINLDQIMVFQILKRERAMNPENDHRLLALSPMGHEFEIFGATLEECRAKKKELMNNATESKSC